MIDSWLDVVVRSIGRRLSIACLPFSFKMFYGSFLMQDGSQA